MSICHRWIGWIAALVALSSAGCEDDRNVAALAPDAGGSDAADGASLRQDASNSDTGAAESGAEADAPSPADAPGDAMPVSPPSVTIDTYPVVDGATSTLPIARVVACELLGLPWKWEVAWDESNQDYLNQVVPDPRTPAEEQLAALVLQKIVHSKTHDAYVRLIQGDAELLLVASRPSVEEATLAAQSGVDLVLQPVALDALVFIVNTANPVDTLTSAQVRSIFGGTLASWADVGGLSGRPIVPYSRPLNSGSQQLLITLVMQGLSAPTWPPDRTPTFMGGMIDAIAGDANGIGYTVFYYLEHIVQGRAVKPIAINGKAATPTTLGARVYPYTSEVWMVTRTSVAPGSHAAELRDWLVSPGGQAAVARSEYVPVGP